MNNQTSDDIIKASLGQDTKDHTSFVIKQEEKQEETYEEKTINNETNTLEIYKNKYKLYNTLYDVCFIIFVLSIISSIFLLFAGMGSIFFLIGGVDLNVPDANIPAIITIVSFVAAIICKIAAFVANNKIKKLAPEEYVKPQNLLRNIIKLIIEVIVIFLVLYLLFILVQHH